VMYEGVYVMQPLYTRYNPSYTFESNK
jgi:hypothetical protein